MHPHQSATVPPREPSHLVRPVVLWMLAAAAAMLLALLFAIQHYFSLRALGHPSSFGGLFAAQLVRWLLWVALAPLILAVARRWRLGDRGLQSYLVQGAAAIVFALGHASLATLIERLGLSPAAVPDAGSLPFSLLARVRTMFAADLLVYGGLLAVYHAMEYYRRYRERELRASRLEARLAQAQLQMLRMQLHPHFLFNTLHAVSSLMHEDVDAADEMLAALSDLLRFTLGGERAQEVPLRQEVEFVRRYLDIMRFRFGDRLRARVDIDPAALEALVPSLLLQPLVENALRHGIADRLEGGEVQLSAERFERTVRLRVRDDGPGLPRGWNEHRDSGLGLRNTRARLRHLYGGAHRMYFANRPSGGLELTLVVPFRPRATPPEPLA